jgi:hypothetical protein
MQRKSSSPNAYRNDVTGEMREIQVERLGAGPAGAARRGLVRLVSHCARAHQELACEQRQGVAPAGGVVGVLVQRSPGLRARRAPALVPVRVDASGRRCEQRSMCSLPKSRSAACLLWARQRNVTRSTECWCALPHGSRWWNSSRARALQRLPEGATNAQRSASRSATARLIRAGMWREGRADARAASLPWGCRRLRRDARANFLRLTSSTSRSSARPKISARSPSGIWCPSNACASRSLSHNARLAVNCTL